jgi:hypothetical protein
LSQSPIVCSVNSRRPHPRNQHVCCAPEPTPLQGPAHPTNRSHSPNPHDLWAGHESRGAP